MVKKYCQKCSTLLAIRKVYIKFTLRFHLTQIRISKINDYFINQYKWGCGEGGTLTNSWWVCKFLKKSKARGIFVEWFMNETYWTIHIDGSLSKISKIRICEICAMLKEKLSFISSAKLVFKSVIARSDNLGVFYIHYYL